MITENFLTVSPAYGRDYKNKLAAERAFRDGADFRMESIGHGGSYCSIRDFDKGVSVIVRYANKRKSTVVEVR